MKTTFTALLMLYALAALSITPPIETSKILASGNGCIMELAFKVNTVDEEYDVLRHLKLVSLNQKLIVRDGYFYDAIQTKNKIIYFKIIKRQLPQPAKTTL